MTRPGEGLAVASGQAELWHSECLERLRAMPDASVHAVVTDPPYGLAFMGKRWDYDVPSVEIWAECLRVLKPGGHLLAFAGTRTQHRMAVRIEDAGFEIRDMLAWVYGSGFPKSLDVSKALDKAAGAEREKTGRVLSVTGNRAAGSNSLARSGLGAVDAGPQAHEETLPATAEAREWDGWGTALKPSLEPITLARKPLGGTVAANVLEHGTGALNVDGCRVGNEVTTTVRNGDSGKHGRYGSDRRVFRRENPPGRWPANLVHDGSAEVLERFPESDGQNGAVRGTEPSRTGKGDANCYGAFAGRRAQEPRGNQGSAARFFYCAKASKAERGEGNRHPTVKPLALMRWLVRLVTPPGGTVLDPFAGSGTTLVAAEAEHLRSIGIEQDAESVETARRRLVQPTLPFE